MNDTLLNNSLIDNDLVTVIVPVFNVENYLDECVQSIVDQTYQNLEIILIDDGSKDSSKEKCDIWRSKDKRIRVIHKINEGLGKARNAGLDNANGKYIVFVDSDDYVRNDLVEKAYNMAYNTNADLVLYGYAKTSNGRKESFIPKTNKTIYENNEVEKYIIPCLVSDYTTGECEELWMSFCGHFFTKKIIEENEWRSTSEKDVISEDSYSLLKLYKHVNKVSILKEELYYYRNNEKSLTHVYAADRIERIKDCYYKSIELCNSLNYSDKIIKSLSNQLFSYVLGALKTIEASNMSFFDKKKEIINIVYDKEIEEIIKGIDINSKRIFRKYMYNALCHKNVNSILFGLKIRSIINI